MDIDVVVGLEKVEEYRKRIEEGTGKKQSQFSIENVAKIIS